jgi:hypothetical protein
MLKRRVQLNNRVPEEIPMQRSMSALFIGMLALTLATGCDEKTKPAATQTVMTRPLLPPDGPGQTLVNPATWRATGKDQVNRRWEGYLMVENTTDSCLLVGYFDWGIDIGGGRYHFKGTYDSATRKVRWTGYSVEHQFGTPGIGTYESTLSPDGRRLENGTWSGPRCMPGTWSAELVDPAGPG